MTKKSIPFYSNTPDDTHCYQAALKMIIAYFSPDENYSWKELEEISAKVPKLWTWPTAGQLWLRNKGLDIISVDSFDREKFILNGEKYLLDFYGEEVGKEQIAHSNIDQEVEIMKRAVENIGYKTGIPTTDDLKKFIDNGYLLICNVNGNTLNSENGYTGHFVVIFDYDENSFFLHNPGLPARPNQEIVIDQFLKAWACPADKSQNVMAIRKQK